MKKRIKNKLFLPLLLLILVSVFTFNSFALEDDSYFDIPYDAGTLYNTTGGTITDSDFTYYSYDEYDDGYYSDRAISWFRKPTGVLAMTYNAGTGYIDSDLQYIVGDVVIQLPWGFYDSVTGYPPRINISIGKSRFATSSTTSTTTNYVGWTIRAEEADHASHLLISTWRTSSYTIDYPSKESYDFNIAGGEITTTTVSNNSGYNYLVELRLKYIINLTNNQVDLYVNSYNGLYYLDTMYCLDPIDFTTIRIGTYDDVIPPTSSSVGGQIFLRSWRIRGGGSLSLAAFNDGYKAGKADGLSLGFKDGYYEGYRDGILDASSSEISVPEVISTYVNSGVTLFRNIFGFEIFGINVAGLIGGLTAVVVLAWLIRKLVR